MGAVEAEVDTEAARACCWLVVGRRRVPFAFAAVLVEEDEMTGPRANRSGDDIDADRLFWCWSRAPVLDVASLLVGDSEEGDPPPAGASSNVVEGIRPSCFCFGVVSGSSAADSVPTRPSSSAASTTAPPPPPPLPAVAAAVVVAGKNAIIGASCARVARSALSTCA